MGLVGAEVAEREVDLLGRLVDDAGVALHEGAAHAVLAGEPHRIALVQQGGEGQVLGGGPVQALALLDGLAPVGDHPVDGLVHRQPLGERGDLAAEVEQLLPGDAGDAALFGARQAQARPLAVQPVGLVGVIDLAAVELCVEEGVELGDPAVDLGLRRRALADQARRIEVADARVILDLRVHQGLGHRRVVTFVVTEPAVAEHVDDHVLAELLAIFGGDLGGEDHGFRIVAVGVEDRRLDHQGDVRRIGRGPAVLRAGGEADLVVDDEVHRAADAVAAQLREREALGHHALAREGRVAVHQERQHVAAARAGVLAQGERLLGARLADHHRVDDLQVRRVGGQRQVDAVAVELAVRRGAQVVLHVARALDV